MAHRHIASSAEVRRFLYDEESFWTVTKSVGYGHQNLDSDVRLVQYFLNVYSRDNSLVVDGKFGGKTWNAIKRFQTRERGIVDGMISPASGDRLKGSISGRIYTMLTMNAYYRTLMPQYYRDLTKDPDLHSALRRHFSVPEYVFDNGVC